jgi:6-pyruvoyltetrahydropterin/6-carboxytetrahydropterin synthase
MFRLSREVRFAINPEPDDQSPASVHNGFGGFPALLGIGHFFSLEVTLLGEPQATTGCVRDIKEIDKAVREHAVPLVAACVRRDRLVSSGAILLKLYELLKNAWPGNELHHLRLVLSPTLMSSIFASEYPMIRLSQKFEFSASHRLHNPALSDEENQRLFGKCNNPHGHGHNYVVQVTLAGKPDANGLIIAVPRFEQIVASTVIEPLDHKNLNVEIPQFSDLIPSVENIALVIFRLLKPQFAPTGATLAGITVWETPKTWCEYME